jgi:serine/threonine-protein kinase
MPDPRAIDSNPTEPAGDLAETVASEPKVAGLDRPLVVLRPEDRYDAGPTIGEGGMGEVRLSRDRMFGRDVAMKVLRSAHAGRDELRMRFVREAKVQAQLEHPAIVPVYDFAEDREGRAFFTMKRVNGITLADVVARLAAGDDEAAREWRRHKLLAAFVRVCLAIDFAHRRGVVHRDLKPANVMLGEWGEVYVLDWGLAKVRDLSAPVESQRGGATSEASSSGSHETAAGAVLGTPAYMAPEQIRGEPIDARTDVYALGAILFEILTLTPLHGEGSAAGMMHRALAGADARPSARAPGSDVAPELEAICVRACAKRAADRFESARELGDLVEAYLSGDRDVELRREVAKTHLSRAQEAASRAFVPGASLDERTEALREVGRALALAPDDKEARALLVRMLTEPPREAPAAVEEAVLDSARESQREALKLGFFAFMSWIAFVPVQLASGVRSFTLLAAPTVLWTFAALFSYASHKWDRHDRWRTFNVIPIGLAIAATSVYFGPLLMIPLICAVLVMAVTMTTRKARRAFVFAGLTLGALVPLVLVVLDLHPVKHVFDGGTSLTIVAAAHGFPRTATLVGLGGSEILLLGVAARFAASYRDALTRAEIQVQLQMWQLRQLVSAPGPD